ncbi:MAG: GDP-mannose 4,6-dehydratase [Bryobacterales bacterium]|nr:GDP-mannose 4,6-dehydratase [Bryobacterales bacterium]MBV9397677.1 GDP-mannose 4,6-dehydratase [Bryobacterales bacterium]
MRVLVTGGAGFIGSHVCERLLCDGHEVSIIDDLNDFYSPALKRENLGCITSAGPACFFHADICDEIAVQRVFDATLPEAVIHLAGRAGVRPSLEQPLLYEQVNVRGTLVLLEQCRRLGIRKFIMASSSSVYGAANRVPFREDDHVSHPISPYAATKIAAERLAYTYSHLYGIGVTCFRFFTVYGPRQRPDLAIRKFTEKILQAQPIPVYGDGSASRDYTFVRDIVNGVMAAIEHDFAYEVFNLGNSSPLSLSDLIRSIETATARKAIIRRLPDQPGDVPITYADVSKAGRLLGYAPKTPFEQGIREFVDWLACRPVGQASACPG